MLMIKSKEVLANEHWEWLSGILEKVYKDAFKHGYKHGQNND